jgi:hypothetical protein
MKQDRPETKNSESRAIERIPIAFFAFIVILIGIFLYTNITSFDLLFKASAYKNLGAVGDFFGGSFNAAALVFVAFGFFIQVKELKLQREELEEGRKTQADISATQKETLKTEKAEILIRRIRNSRPENSHGHLKHAYHLIDATTALNWIGNNFKSSTGEFDVTHAREEYVSLMCSAFSAMDINTVTSLVSQFKKPELAKLFHSTDFYHEKIRELAIFRDELKNLTQAEVQLTIPKDYLEQTPVKDSVRAKSQL